MMARTHAGLDDPHGTQASLAAALGGLALGPADEPPAGAPQQTWNADVVVDALAAAVRSRPATAWTSVSRVVSPAEGLPQVPGSAGVKELCQPLEHPRQAGAGRLRMER